MKKSILLAAISINIIGSIVAMGNYRSVQAPNASTRMPAKNWFGPQDLRKGLERDLQKEFKKARKGIDQGPTETTVGDMTAPSEYENIKARIEKMGGIVQEQDDTVIVSWPK